jgi:hypothetical protein
MKHIQIFKTIVLGTIISLASFVSNAGETPENASQLKYVGIVENKPAFRLTLNANTDALFVVTVSNKSLGTIYTQKIKAKSRTMLIQLDEWDLNADALQVEVKNIETKETELFAINMQSRTVIETSINKF